MYPTWKRAVAWDLREIGSAWGVGCEGGPGPPGGGEDKPSVPNNGRDDMGKDKRDQPSRT